MGPGVRVTGLWLVGPDPKRHLDHHNRSFSAEAQARHKQTWPDAARRPCLLLPLPQLGVHHQQP